MKSATQEIPEKLVYEMQDGKAIYYKDYRTYLSGSKHFEELMGSSYLQSLIITRLVFLLMSNLSNRYTVLTNEVGLKTKSKSWRAADIAIFETEKLKNQKQTAKYLVLPPKVIIEIDTKAELSEAKDSFGYFHKKTDELLAFGVEKVIWIFTDSQKIMIARKDSDWQIHNWDKAVDVLEGVQFRIKQLIED